MQNIRVPTRLLGDEFSGSGIKPYTLQRMREEEHLLNEFGASGDTEIKSERSSNYEVIEEMYEHMNSFDQKMKIKNNATFY